MTNDETATTAPSLIPEGPIEEIADGLHVILDRRINLVPNIGIVVGERAALVVDTAMGPASGELVLRRARGITDRPLLLTVSHFHPEHGFGAQVFERHAAIVYNRAQKEELDEKGGPYVELFRTFGPVVAEALEGVELISPHVVYDDRATIDLGGVAVELGFHGRAHTRGDQVVFLPEQRILFAGDLVENRFFPIFPWFPPDDVDVTGEGWIAVLERLETLEPELVVPGNGEVGGAELIGEVRRYLEDVRGRVRAAAAAGRSAEEAKAALEADIRSAYASWDNPEWIGFAIEAFHAQLAG